MTSKNSGYTLIELLVFMGIFSLIIVSFITISVTMFGFQASQSAAAEVSQQSQFLLQQMQYYISSARLVDMTQDVATSTLALRVASAAQDPTLITVSGGVLYLQQGVAGALTPLTSNKVSISNFSVTRHYNLSGSSLAYGMDSVSYSFTLSATSTNGQPYTQSFQSSASVFTPVGSIAMIQQAKGDNNSPIPNVLSIAVAYPTNNESSSLLIAVVANTSASATVSVADTAGNVWSMIASTSYPAYNTKLTLFNAVNAKNSANTVTASFGGGAGYASMFVYEYRGASTSTSFDASSSQLQPNTSTPSSGFANPTSTVELIFGVTSNATTLQIPTAGSGFTIETSSTVSHAFVEDMIQYVTGPVAATWQYGPTSPSSLALVATFK